MWTTEKIIDKFSSIFYIETVEAKKKPTTFKLEVVRKEIYMKKEMFNQWYEEYGKEIAKNSLPIDNVDEKEIRITAKEKGSRRKMLLRLRNRSNICWISLGPTT